MKTKRPIKSANETEDENQFELDETIVDEVSNAEEFADDDISHEDVMDAVQAIEALAETVIEEANVEQKEIDADALLDEIRDLIDEEPAENEFPEEEELPEELVNSAVRVMVSEDGAVELESTPDEVYDSEVDGLACTMLDTCDDYDLELEDTAEGAGDDLLVIGNSKAKNFKKGFVVLKSSANKKCWSAAYKKVKKMIGSAKMTAAHWAIVSALAAKEEQHQKLVNKLERKILKIVRSNKKFIKSGLLKSSEEFDADGQPITETKPEQTAPADNPGFEEGKDPTQETSPEQIDSTSGNPVEDPDKQNDTEGDVILPDGESVVMEVPLTNSKKKIVAKKITSSKVRNCNVYKVLNNSKELESLDGQCIKSGNIGYVFKSTAVGLLVCAAKYVDTGKGTYRPVLKNNKVVVTRGKEYPIFNNAEKVVIAQKIASAREIGRLQAKKNEILASRQTPKAPARRPINSARNPLAPKAPARRRPVMSNMDKQKKLNEIKSARDARMAVQSARQHEVELQKKYDQEERQRLFQSSQRELNSEKTLLKSNNTRNTEALNKLYKGMF